MRSLARCAFISLVAVGLSSTAFAQPAARRLLEPASGQPLQPRGKSVAEMRHAFKRLDPAALSFDRIELTLFDDVQLTARRMARSHPRKGSTVWHGTLESPHKGDVTLAMVDGVLSGNLTADGRMFEIGFSADGLHVVRELNPALFPTEDPPHEPFAGDGSPGVLGGSAAPTQSFDSGGQIDVMVLWTPAARNAVGGSTAAIQSLVDLAVANANASYSRSYIGTSLRLVHSAEVSFSETRTSMGTDLTRLTGRQDGYIDDIHAWRDAVGADVVTLIGAGYSASCGVAYVMSSVSTSFASQAFNVVDQSCAAGNLSYAHEVGHSQGLHHDPANASGSASHPFAYGYQDPAGAFRTVMSYGSAARVQQFSNPWVYYAGRPTGTTMQDNARALNNNAPTVANFRSATATPACNYTVAPGAVDFPAEGGVLYLQVITNDGCAWTTGGSGAWAAVGPGGSGSGSVAVATAENQGYARSTTMSIAGQSITLNQNAPASPCTFSVTPQSVSVPSAGGLAFLYVNTQEGCTWYISTDAGWLYVVGGGAGPGWAGMQASPSALRSRSAAVYVGGQAITVTQGGGTGKKGH